MKYKILIFDLDDTLIDNQENTKFAFAKMLSEKGIEYSEEKFATWRAIDTQFWLDRQDGKIEIPDNLRNETGKKSDEFLDWLRSQRVLLYFNNSITNREAIDLNTMYMHSLNEKVVPTKGARDVLEYLAKKYKIIVATNGPSVATEQKLKKIQCLQCISEVLSADMIGYMKPRTEFFNAIEKRYADHTTSDYLIIGDSLKSDVGLGMNTGIDSCWLNRNNDELENSYTPTYVIKELGELKQLL